jgi:hypothetical protein
MARPDRGSHSPERVQRSQQKILEQHANLDALQLDVQVALADGDRESVELALRAFSGAVEAHFDLEESAYFPERTHLADDLAAALDKLMDDHESLRERLRELRHTLDHDGIPALRGAYDPFISALDDHEAREEKAIELIASRA